MKIEMKKKAILVLLMTAYLLSVFNINAFAASFPDMPRSHKNYAAVTELVDMGVIAGYDDGYFRPEREITRTEFCALMARTLGYNKDTYVFEKTPFTDVKEGYWGEAYISFCYEMGLINGMGNNEFWPAAKVTMEQALKMAVCAIGKEDEALQIIGEKWYSGYVKTASEYSLGYKIYGQLGSPAIRSDIAQIVYNMTNTGLLKQEEEKVPEEDIIPDNKPEDTKDEEEEYIDPIPPEIREAFRKKDPLDVKTILIDAGHNYSGRDTGAENKELELKEEDLTWQIADKLRQRLEKMGYKVVMTRDKITDSIANTSVVESLQARVDLGHQSLADLFISIHCNAGGGSGTEVYCFNKQSYAGVFADIVQKNIVVNTGLYDRETKTANFFVIQNTLMPAILIETGFIDNLNDVKILASEEGQQSIAKAVADAVAEYDNMEYEDFVQSIRTKILTEELKETARGTSDEE